MNRIILAITCSGLLGVFLGYLLFADLTHSGGDITASGEEKEVLYWVAPMDPNYRRDAPGKSPMGMDLVPVYASDEGEADQPGVRVDPNLVQGLGIKTATVERGPLPRLIEAPVYIEADASRVAHVHVRTAGWIEKLNRKAVGEQVTKGELLFELFAPELLAAQGEFLQAVRSGRSTIVTAARERLINLGMTRQMIDKVERTGTPLSRIEVKAPQDGLIIHLSIGEGMYVTPGKTIFGLVDTKQVWAIAEVFASNLENISPGSAAEITLGTSGHQTFAAQADYIYPMVDGKSQTVKVRFPLANPESHLLLGQYGKAVLTVAGQAETLSIPRQAVIRTGDVDRVILALNDGRFRPAQVVVGHESGDRIAVRQGLEEKEKVVVSGQFLLDSEASFDAAMIRMLPQQQHQTVHHVRGVLDRLNDDGTVTLIHGPIETLGMPGMTMSFRVGQNVFLSQQQVGDRYLFSVIQNDDGWLEIMDLEAVQ